MTFRICPTCHMPNACDYHQECRDSEHYDIDGKPLPTKIFSEEARTTPVLHACPSSVEYLWRQPGAKMQTERETLRLWQREALEYARTHELVIVQADHCAPPYLTTRIVADSAAWTGRSTPDVETLRRAYGAKPRVVALSPNVVWYGLVFGSAMWLAFIAIAVGGLIGYAVKS